MSMNVLFSLTTIADLGPRQFMVVPSPPLSLQTTSRARAKSNDSLSGMGRDVYSTIFFLSGLRRDFHLPIFGGSV